MTEDQHIQLVRLAESFDKDFAWAAARIVRELPWEMRDEVITFLQDRCSLFNPHIYSLVIRYAEKLNG
jgi:hypothetical protein